MAPSDPPGHPPDQDDERTVIVAAAGNGVALPFGHVLQEYVVESVIGEGGFSIVYLARDTRLGRHVALKEYMPTSLAVRGGDCSVSVRSPRLRETFDLGLRSFVNEAQLLASFDHPSLVKVYRFWEASGTAYMVMPLYQGPTLKKWLSQLGHVPDEAWLRALLAPMIDALEHLHDDHCYHRDIAPDNILLLPVPAMQADAPGHTVRPLLLDFGAARRVIGDATHDLTVILKPGYAPIEQYAESASMQQGPWTDVYALCAVLYACITGRAPAPSVSRMISDDMPPAAKAGTGRYSPQFLGAIDAGLAVRPGDRPQSMMALREAFFAARDEVALPPHYASSHESAPAQRIDPVLTAAPGSDRHAAATRAQVPASSTATYQPKSTSALPRVAWALAGIALLAGAGWWWLGPHGDSATEVAVAIPATSAGPIPRVPASVETPPPTVVEAPAFSVPAALQDIVDRRDPKIEVSAVADKATLTIGKDLLRFRVSSSEPGYLYVFTGGTGQDHFWLLYPDKPGRNNRIDRNQAVVLPPKGSDYVADGPPGTSRIVTVVSRHKRDFADTGLSRAGDAVQEFDLGVARQRWAQRPADANAASPFIGKALCGAAPCDDAYGATLIEIHETGAPARK